MATPAAGCRSSARQRDAAELQLRQAVGAGPVTDGRAERGRIRLVPRL